MAELSCRPRLWFGVTNLNLVVNFPELLQGIQWVDKLYYIILLYTCLDLWCWCFFDECVDRRGQIISRCKECLGFSYSLTPADQQTKFQEYSTDSWVRYQYSISTVPTALPVPCPTARAQLRGMQSNDDGHNFWMQSSRVHVWEKNLWKPKSCKLDELMSEVCFYAAYGTTGVAAALTLVYTSESCT